jgi:hypothetical protein
MKDLGAGQIAQHHVVIPIRNEMKCSEGTLN